jgi:hypothetical protein
MKILSLVICTFLASATFCFSQATRTWVSGVGDDANPGSRTAPCKTFAGAISKTAPGGEINVLDPGGFGALTITKSITIIGQSVESGVLVSGTNGIVVNAGPSDVVTLEGLDFEGLGTGLSGVKFLSGAELIIKNCRIHNFSNSPNGIGIDIEPTTRSRVLVTDTLVDFNVTGILVKPSAGTVTKVFLDRVTIHRNIPTGLTADGSTAEVDLFNSIITSNGTGLSIQNSAVVSSFGNNAIFANVTDGGPTNTVGLK